MKHRKATGLAATALMGWYLIMPPAPSLTTADRILRAYDSAAQCEHDLAYMKAGVGTDAKAGKTPSDVDSEIRRVYQGRYHSVEQMTADSKCMASDDPRLAK